MPFVPLSPEEEKRFEPPCQSDQHNPPSHMVITRPMKWKCPACGAETIVYPTMIRCSDYDGQSRTTTADFEEIRHIVSDRK